MLTHIICRGIHFFLSFSLVKLSMSHFGRFSRCIFCSTLSVCVCVSVHCFCFANKCTYELFIPHSFIQSRVCFVLLFLSLCAFECSMLIAFISGFFVCVLTVVLGTGWLMVMMRARTMVLGKTINFIWIWHHSKRMVHASQWLSLPWYGNCSVIRRRHKIIIKNAKNIYFSLSFCVCALRWSRRCCAVVSFLFRFTFDIMKTIKFSLLLSPLLAPAISTRRKWLIPSNNSTA